MTQLISTASPPWFLGQNEYAIYSYLEPAPRTPFIYSRNLYVQEEFAVTWPASRLQGGWALGARVEQGSYDPLQVYTWSGSARWLQISGITRDANANPLGGCTVKLYRTSDDLELMSTVSASDGYYQVATNEAFQCYLVAYKAGSTDVFGTSPNTIIGA